MKTDKELGFKIAEHLESKQLETPITLNSIFPDKTSQIKIISNHFKGIMDALGLDLNNDSLKDTPQRVAKMYVDEIFSGLDYDNFPKCTTVKNEFKMDEMITVSNIKSISVCEHHFVTIDGLCKIAYIPNDKVLGLSKFNRIVKFFSQRPQIQERLTLQIYEALAYILETENVAVMIEADHYCVKQRGVEDNSRTTTTKLGGVFKENEVRNEFLKA
jgi:GTP cyclohydrolase I